MCNIKILALLFISWNSFTRSYTSNNNTSSNAAWNWIVAITRCENGFWKNKMCICNEGFQGERCDKRFCNVICYCDSKNACIVPCPKNAFSCEENCVCIYGICYNPDGTCPRLVKDKQSRENSTLLLGVIFLVVGIAVLVAAFTTLISIYIRRKKDTASKRVITEQSTYEEVENNQDSTQHHDAQYFKNYEVPCHVSARLSIASYCIPKYSQPKLMFN